MPKQRASANGPGTSEITTKDVLIELHFEATQIDELMRAASIAFDAFPRNAPVSAVLNAAHEKMAILCSALEEVSRGLD